jgi:hypothetical protein
VNGKQADHSSSQLSSVCISWLAAALCDTCTVQYIARQLITVAHKLEVFVSVGLQQHLVTPVQYSKLQGS